MQPSAGQLVPQRRDRDTIEKGPCWAQTGFAPNEIAGTMGHDHVLRDRLLGFPILPGAEAPGYCMRRSYGAQHTEDNATPGCSLTTGGFLEKQFNAASRRPQISRPLLDKGRSPDIFVATRSHRQIAGPASQGPQHQSAARRR